MARALRPSKTVTMILREKKKPPADTKWEVCIEQIQRFSPADIWVAFAMWDHSNRGQNDLLPVKLVACTFPGSHVSGSVIGALLACLQITRRRVFPSDSRCGAVRCSTVGRGDGSFWEII